MNLTEIDNSERTIEFVLVGLFLPLLPGMNWDEPAALKKSCNDERKEDQNDSLSIVPRDAKCSFGWDY
jgi:hypothetical protein